LTIQEEFQTLKGLTLTYVGDGNNVANSLMLGCAMVGMNVKIATPSGYEPSSDVVEKARAISNGKTEVVITKDPKLAAKNANILYTDVWASMGQEEEASDRMPIFKPYQINQELLSFADPKAIVLHCLPAHRDEEITNDVIEGENSRVWDQAENRLHAQKALLASILEAEQL
ncbi:MAG: ornithine carbamoyltransferase, partial [Cyanobacteria bacterium J06649_11]